ncbi:MAG TPA: TonB-dependent receptor, partial [Dyella sp.]|uniref:TonB-dependent receptor plug domain-containing protein n=1 Tax=Dyella sp. TaxID=1869338 RepID=UPI002C42E301
MSKHPIAVAVMAALSLMMAATLQAQATAASQDGTSQQDNGQTSGSPQPAQAKHLDTVIVSGSLINNAQIQTATPTYTITAQDMQARGFNSVADVLQNSVFATGTVPGSQTPGFNQGSQTFSFYGLNPEYTLTLLDGKPISQFGQLYGGVSDFTNVGNIPMSIVDHIDILPGGGSSIYGSQAISGVVNIVTKQHMDGAEVSVRTGNYSLGGGANQRMSIAFGHRFGKLDVTGTFEFFNQSPAWYYQRDLTTAAPRPIIVAAMWDYGTGLGSPLQGFVPPPNGCGALSNLFAGTTTQVYRAPYTGSFCGSPKTYSYGTFINQSRSYSSMLKLRYDLNDYVRLYGDVLASWQQQKFTAGIAYNWWGPADLPGGMIEDASTHQVLYPERFFAPEEVGDNNYDGLLRQDDLMYQADLGANGTFGDSNWDWDVYFLRSGERTTDLSPLHPAAAVDGFFESILGPVVGVDPNTGYNMYHPNYSAFFSPITPAQYNSFTINVNALYNTWINNLRGTVSNDHLFHLPGGDAGFAWLVEGGNQAWYNPVNPLVANGLLWGNTGVSGGGQRDHYASAFQLNLPVLSQFTVDLSGRTDRYTVQNGSPNTKFTYKIGLEYRPFDTLLVRGNYATGFIAPDMSSIFLGPSGQYNSVTDYYLCATQGGNQNCTANYTEGVKINVQPNKKLQPTNSASWTFGTVWAPLRNLSLSADFLHIAINNEIQLQSSDMLMRQEAQCRLGQLPSDSAVCQNAYA